MDPSSAQDDQKENQREVSPVLQLARRLDQYFISCHQSKSRERTASLNSATIGKNAGQAMEANEVQVNLPSS